ARATYHCARMRRVAGQGLARGTKFVNRRDLLKSLGGAAVLALSAACSQASAPAPTASPPASAAAPTAAPAAAQTTPAQVAATGSQVAITFWGAFTGHNA